MRNVRAGVDIVLTTGGGSYIQVYRGLLAEARRDPAFRMRVRESAARVHALRRSLAESPAQRFMGHPRSGHHPLSVTLKSSRVGHGPCQDSEEEHA